MSFGWESVKSEVDTQIDLARHKGILLVAAASNDSGFTLEHEMYLASNQPVYCIYSCRGSVLKSEFNSRSSKDMTSFMFPGEDVAILGARHKPRESVGRLNGTSFATPVAAGTAAMVLDLARLELKDFMEVEWRLKKYEEMSHIFQAMSGGGRVLPCKTMDVAGRRKANTVATQCQRDTPVVHSDEGARKVGELWPVQEAAVLDQ